MNLMQIFGGQAHLVWIAAGVLLCAGEMLTPGIFLLFIGMAAIVTGLILSLFTISFIWSIMLFGALAALAVYLGQRFYGSRQTSSDQPFLNRRADGLVGRTFALSDAIKGGEGVIRVNDTRWKVHGPDMPAGTKVRVTGVEDAAILLVEQV